MRIYTRLELIWNSKLGKYIETYEESYEYNGDLALCGGGGGTSGSVEHPSYIEKTYQLMLTGEVSDPIAADYKTGADDGTAGVSLLTAMATATTAVNPYENAVAYAPDSLLSQQQGALDILDTATKSQDVTTETARWGELHDSAKTKSDALFTGDAIDELVESYADKTVDDFNTEVSRYSAGMSAINSVNSSAFILGMGLLSRKRLTSINEFRAQQVSQREQLKAEYMKNAIHEMANLMNMHMGNRIEVMRFQAEVNRLSIIAKKEQFEKDIEYDREDALWDIGVIGKGMNIMASPGGGVALPEKPSQGASAMSGALAGASIGAAFGPPGAAIGAALGGIGGALSAG